MFTKLICCLSIFRPSIERKILKAGISTSSETKRILEDEYQKRKKELTGIRSSETKRTSEDEYQKRKKELTGIRSSETKRTSEDEYQKRKKELTGIRSRRKLCETLNVLTIKAEENGDIESLFIDTNFLNDLDIGCKIVSKKELKEISVKDKSNMTIEEIEKDFEKDLKLLEIRINALKKRKELLSWL